MSGTAGAGPGGPTVIVETSHDLPVVCVQLIFRAGSAVDPPGREGLARMTAEALRRGAGGRSRAAIDEALDRLGADLGASAGPDSLALTGHVLRRNLDAFVDLLGDVVGAPDFPDEEVEKVRGEMRAALDEMRDDDRDLCGRHFARQLYGDHPYGRPPSGVDASLAAIGRDELREFYTARVRRDGVVVGVSGDADAATVDRVVARLVARIPEGAVPLPPPPPDPPEPAGRVVLVVDKPERTQVQTLCGHPAPRWGTRDYDALQVATTAFGGVFTGRLMTEVRARRGLSYGAYASLHGGRGRAHVEMWVFPAAADTVKTLELVLSLYDDFAAKGLEDAEVDFARRYLVGHFPLAIETPERRLAHRTDLAVCDLPPDFLARYRERIGGVTAADVRAAIARHATPRRLAIAMVADAKKLVPELEAARARLGLGEIRVEPHDSF